MRVSIDLAADAARVQFSDAPPAKGRSQEVASGVVIDFDDTGRAVALEIVGLRSRMTEPAKVEVDLAGPGELLPDDDPLVEHLRAAGAFDEGNHAVTA